MADCRRAYNVVFKYLKERKESAEFVEHKLCFGQGAMRHVTSVDPGGARRSHTPGRSRGPDERITNAERMLGKALMPSARAKPGPIIKFIFIPFLLVFFPTQRWPPIARLVPDALCYGPGLCPG